MKIFIHPKFVLALSFILGLSAYSFSQSDKQAEDILKSVSAKYKSFTSLKAEFLYTMDDPQSKTKETQSGSITVKGDKYILQIKGQDVISDGKTLWTILQDAKEVQISEPEKNAEAVTPSNIFTMYEKGYDSKFIEEKNENGKDVQIIELKPQDSKKNFFKVRLTIEKNGKLITSTTVFNKNGSKATYSIKQFTPNPAVTDAQFSFDKAKNPGMEIIDLR